MALIKCNECGQSVSDKADSCPNCGNPIAGASGHKRYYGHHESHQASRVANINKWLWALVALLIVGISILGYFLFDKDQSTNRRNDVIEIPQSSELENHGQAKQSHTSDNKHDRAVSELKELLAKTDGMRFGSSKMVLTSSSYDEKNNVVKFRFTQRVFPHDEGTPELIKEISYAARETRKRALTEMTLLMRLMEPLRPTIRDIIYYPDGDVAYTYDIEYNDLYYND